MVKKSAVLGVLLALIAVSLGAAGKAEDPPSLRGNGSVTIPGAEITKISPLNVLPGTLVSVEGSGFGSVPGSVRIGSLEIRDFLGWEDECVFFRIPKSGLPGPSELKIGNAYAEDLLRPAPPGSLTVMWTVDVAALQAKADAEWQGVYNAPSRPTFTAPLYLKGQWTKSGEHYGTASTGWDTGSKVRMLKDRSGQKWYAELVLTPDNIASFGVKAMLFAFEDGNNLQRDLVPYESNIMFILKKDWAKTDYFTSVNSDPALRPGPGDKLYNKETNTIYITYPVKK